MAVIMTSFTKIIVVVSILRNALGLQSTPPAMVLNALALILSAYIMFPTLSSTYELAKQADYSEMSLEKAGEIVNEIKGPILEFLSRNTAVTYREFFYKTAQRTWPEEAAKSLTMDHFLILLPAFVVSELTAAFQIGFIIYLPFVIVDLVVSNILLSLGMMMISPTTISLPFKLLLFTLVDGWVRLLEGLVLTYRL